MIALQTVDEWAAGELISNPILISRFQAVLSLTPIGHASIHLSIKCRIMIGIAKMQQFMQGDLLNAILCGLYQL